MKKSTSVDEYIAGFPKDVRQYLDEIRTTIRNAAPGAQETISYHMPCYKLNGNLVFFGAFRDHIGFYPMPSAIKKFKAELSGFKTGKGTIQFHFDKPLPKNLITRIVKFRLDENTRMKKA